MSYERYICLDFVLSYYFLFMPSFPRCRVLMCRHQSVYQDQPASFVREQPRPKRLLVSKCDKIIQMLQSWRPSLDDMRLNGVDQINSEAGISICVIVVFFLHPVW